jgi:chromosome segregation ATPase
MATATLPQQQSGSVSDDQLAREIAAANSAITIEQKDIDWIEGQISGEIEELAALRKEYGSACKALAQGRDADIIGLQDKMKKREAKIEGLRLAIGEKQAVLAPRKAERDRLQQEQFNRKHQRELAAEQAAINREVDEGLSAIAARDAAQEQINRAIFGLRNRTCMTPANNTLAKNCAMRVERQAHGIIT